MNRRQLLKGYFFVIFSAVIFGSLPALVKSIYAEGVNSLSVILWRNLFSAPLAGIIACCQHKTLRIPAKALPSVAAVGLMGCCVAPLLLFSSYFFIGAGIATVFHFVYPAVVVLGGVLCYRERMNPGHLISVVMCVVGVCLFYTPGEPLDWRGGVLALVSGVAYAVYILLLAHFKYREITGYLLSFYIFAINAAVMLVVCLALDMLTVPASLTGWLLCLLLAVAVNVCAVAMFQKGTFLIGGPQASVLSTLEPITGVLVGVMVFQETMSPLNGLGSALVILAGVIIVFADLRRKEQV